MYVCVCVYICAHIYMNVIDIMYRYMSWLWIRNDAHTYADVCVCARARIIYIGCVSVARACQCARRLEYKSLETARLWKLKRGRGQEELRKAWGDVHSHKRQVGFKHVLIQ